MGTDPTGDQASEVAEASALEVESIIAEALRPGGYVDRRFGWRGWGPNVVADDRPADHDDGLPWEWFELVAVRVMDDLAFIRFRWREPGTPPELTYLIVTFVNPVIPASAGELVRGAMSGLRPGWRERWPHIWLGAGLVFVHMGSARMPAARDKEQWGGVDPSEG